MTQEQQRFATALAMVFGIIALTFFGGMLLLWLGVAGEIPN